jgi:hypothetical protein
MKKLNGPSVKFEPLQVFAFGMDILVFIKSYKSLLVTLHNDKDEESNRSKWIDEESFKNYSSMFDKLVTEFSKILFKPNNINPTPFQSFDPLTTQQLTPSPSLAEEQETGDSEQSLYDLVVKLYDVINDFSSHLVGKQLAGFANGSKVWLVPMHTHLSTILANFLSKSNSEIFQNSESQAFLFSKLAVVLHEILINKNVFYQTNLLDLENPNIKFIYFSTFFNLSYPKNLVAVYIGTEGDKSDNLLPYINRSKFNTGKRACIAAEYCIFNKDEYSNQIDTMTFSILPLLGLLA